jgi:predicted restriction endonuclease
MSDKQLHKKWRKEFREGVFERDLYTCQVCGHTDNLDAHHITDRHEMPNGGYTLSNGISLCPECHLKAEQFHISNKIMFEAGFHPDDLYNLIDSSYVIAYNDSLKLK